MEELEQCRQEPFPLLCGRLGIANLFNPLRPEREYALDLRNHDEATVAQLLVILTAEPGAALRTFTLTLTLHARRNNHLLRGFRRAKPRPIFAQRSLGQTVLTKRMIDDVFGIMMQGRILCTRLTTACRSTWA